MGIFCGKTGTYSVPLTVHTEGPIVVQGPILVFNSQYDVTTLFCYKSPVWHYQLFISWLNSVSSSRTVVNIQVNMQDWAVSTWNLCINKVLWILRPSMVIRFKSIPNLKVTETLDWSHKDSTDSLTSTEQNNPSRIDLWSSQGLLPPQHASGICKNDISSVEN